MAKPHHGPLRDVGVSATRANGTASAEKARLAGARRHSAQLAPDNGAGIGASHQTGWTGLVAKLIQQCAEYCGQAKDPLSRRSADERLAELVAR